MRDFFIHNALYWIEEYHVDGLRLDAVHAIRDESRQDILEELADTVRRAVPHGRHVHLVLENDDNRARYLARDEHGKPRWYVAQWNDDLHHALHRAVTGETFGYYGDYANAQACLGRALAEGFAYQGETSSHREGAARGEPSAHLPPTAFVSFLQNHDQVGNRAAGERIGALTPAPALRAAVATFLLAPSPPLLFMGEEWNAPHPFLFFCDFGPDLAEAVREGRRREFSRFPEFASATLPDPLAPETFRESSLDWSRLSLPEHREWLEFYRSLLAIRQREITPRLARLTKGNARWRLHRETVVDVQWTLDAGAELRAVIALSGAPTTDILIEPRGRLIFSTAPDHAQGPLRSVPPWFVAWFIEDRGERR